MRIAIIGTGIAGMVAAHLLHEDHDIVVFEANDYVGGHTHTIDVEIGGRSYAVDTGFIVFNERNYPNFVRLLQKSGVAWQASDMSFSVQDRRAGLEYRPSSLNTLFAQRKNLLRPSFLRMIWEIFRFRRVSQELLCSPDNDMTLGAYLRKKGFSSAFTHQFIIPMGSAIWSADPNQLERFPARYFVQFFHNHGFLNLRDQPQWLVIKGGSRQYVAKISAPFEDRIRLNMPVVTIRRLAKSVEVTPKGHEPESFDRVIIATHSDQALTMLADPSDAEREILGTFPYNQNQTFLHTDNSVLPRRRAVWASWNYLIPTEPTQRLAITYDMNILQSLAAPAEFCVTLNPPSGIDPDRIIRQMVYHHPVYTTRAPHAQKRHHEINHINRTYFCGAYWGYGFHEDGVNSALAVCKYFGESL
jgi:predicted NAD/FAD-binding protein